MADGGPIQLTSYTEARQYAEDVYSIASAINAVFDEQTDTMSRLFGTDWQSDGSISSRADDMRRFGEKYKPLYEKLVATSVAIHNATDILAAGDNKASEEVIG